VSQIKVGHPFNTNAPMKAVRCFAKAAMGRSTVLQLQPPGVSVRGTRALVVQNKDYLSARRRLLCECSAPPRKNKHSGRTEGRLSAYLQTMAINQQPTDNGRRRQTELVGKGAIAENALPSFSGLEATSSLAGWCTAAVGRA
jgi:hypothetical protein